MNVKLKETRLLWKGFSSDEKKVKSKNDLGDELTNN